MSEVSLRPQPGPQEMFLSSPADIAIYGGAAGAGKTFAILMEALRHVTNNEQFAAVIFRRTMPQIKNPGGLWDASMKMYPTTGAEPTASVSEWKWPGGGKVKMSHLEHESDKFSWQGAEIPLIIFDEITHFTEGQFFYLLSRNRSTCGVRPYVRGTTNPDADSWVARFISWWIDPETGFPIPERAGVVRWFIRINDVMLWGDSREELVEKYGNPDLPADHFEQVQPKSVTFVPGKLSDNMVLMQADPGYLANLKSLPLVEQARLLGGNWKIKPSSGLYFKRDWCKKIHRSAVPTDLEIVRYWDLAATEKTDSNDPDWTCGVKLGRSRSSGLYYWLDTVLIRASPLGVKKALKMTALADGPNVRIGLPQDPGQAGKSQVQDLISHLDTFNVRARPERGDKIVRFGPFSSQAQAGNVIVVEAPWNEDAFTMLEAFPEPSAHDDPVDGCSGAYQMLNDGNTGLLEFYREQAEAAKASQETSAPEKPGGSIFQQAFG
jgi:predicted phage terminase large subunit-like protein